MSDSIAATLTCRTADRRRRLFGNRDWNGMDHLEVSDDQRRLCVHFFGPVPEGLTPEHVLIEGGRRIRGIRATAVDIERSDDPEIDDCLRITLDRFGDFSTYRLRLVERVPESAGGGWRPLAGLDPRYAALDVRFKLDCPGDLDCRDDTPCPPPALPEPDINYLAKDYASFRQLILDRLALIMPDWRERHAPDLGVTLVELLAYAGDHLSYHQDAVGTEAYLDTARLRVSVRRHARLVDYRLHEGCNARSWVVVETESDLPPLAARDVAFITGHAAIDPDRGLLSSAELSGVPADDFETFEPLTADPDATLVLRAAHSRIRIHEWGDEDCCLPAGSTRATLVDEGRTLWLTPGDVLVFEEVLGPRTGLAADADPAHRHAVRLTAVEAGEDGLLGVPVLEVAWDEADALPFPLRVSARLDWPECRRIADVSVARGNAVPVDHGRSLPAETLGPVEAGDPLGTCGCPGSVPEVTVPPRPFAPRLAAGPLVHAEPADATAPASRLAVQDPRRALPCLTLTEVREDGAGPAWSPRWDLLDSGPDDRHLVAETDDDRRTRLRFGDGRLGRLPDAGTRFEARCRIGGGPAGNVGRDSIRHMVLLTGTLSVDGVRPRNPLPASGGTAPEPVAEARLYAPTAFRRRLERAILPDDYALLAAGDPRVQRAAAELRWTGSWYEARVAVDPLGGEADAALLRAVDGRLHRYRRAGHEVAVVSARTVPVDLELTLCVAAHHTRAGVRAALLAAFGNRRRADGAPGFFHPDRLSFGDGIALSRIVAAAMAVPGVEAAKVTRLKRQHEPDSGALDSGLLAFGPMEVPQLDNDPDAPENGRLTLILRGGR